MQLLLIRHAIAEEAGPEIDDADRALTRRGRRRFEQGVKGLCALGLHVDQLLFSPRLRAVQTAELAAPLLRRLGVAQICDLLAQPHGDALRDCFVGERVALVGHEPWLSALCAALVVGPRADGAAFAMKKGGVALLEGEPRDGQMALIGFYPPALLRKLGRAT